LGVVPIWHHKEFGPYDGSRGSARTTQTQRPDTPEIYMPITFAPARSWPDVSSLV